MSFRRFRSKGLPVVRIGGVPYILNMTRRQLRAVYDPDDDIDLDEELPGVDAQEDAGGSPVQETTDSVV